MGTKHSREDKICLLDDDDDDNPLEYHPVFQEIKLVLIGRHRAETMVIGNGILRKKVFTNWTFFNRSHIQATRTVSGRRIHLSLTKGWKRELKSQKTIRAIVHCVQTVYTTGPHAVILVLKVNSQLSESTISTLERKLSAQLWDHTIVVFTNGEKLGQLSIEDYIRSEELQPLIDKCGRRYLEIRNNDTSQITERIEELIASKTSTSFFKISNQNEDDVNTLLTDWRNIVRRGKCKIDFLSKCKRKLKDKLEENPKYEDKIKAKDAEIERLKNIVREKEREIARLRSDIENRPELISLQQRITELEHQVKEKNEEIARKEAEIKDLKTELQMCREREWETPDDVSVSSGMDIPLKELHTRDSALQGWSSALLDILTELTDPELKKMKHYMCENGEFRIPQSSVESKDRVDLAKLMLKQWGERRSVIKTRDLVKRIPRNDDNMKDLFTPFLEDLGETW